MKRLKEIVRNDPGVIPGTAAAVVVGLCLVAFVGWAVSRLVTGDLTFTEATCIDPTDPCNWSSYRVYNDTSAPVVLDECGPCGPIKVAPGETTRNSVYVVNAIIGERTRWRVQTPSGTVRGCLWLDGHRHKRDGALVNVSSAGPCTTNAPTTPVVTYAGA